jgi:hypothetical protein
MKRKKVDSKIEEKMITAMITNKEFLAQVVPFLEVDLLSGSHFQKVAEWCIKYFNKYHKAPQQHIETMYHAWAEKGKAKEETVEAVSDILEMLSDNYEDDNQTNIPYLMDEVSGHLQMRKIGRLRDNLEYSLAEYDYSIAEKALNSFAHASLGVSTGIDILRDYKAWDNAFSEVQKSLFSVGTQEVQAFFSNAFCRDNLIAILAPEKRGKTFWCVEFSIRALMCRKKVALFEVGDMSESQIMKRIGVRLSGKPMFQNQLGEIQIPRKIMKMRDQGAKIKFESKNYRTTTNKKLCKEATKKFMRRFGISADHPYFMASIHPNSSINIEGINSILDRWAIEKDFVPDIIIIDYPDILADEPNTGNATTRDKENIKWKALRRLSQERHCLVIAPTQADAASYEVHTLTAKNFSEDKRKLGHVTGMLGLNQTIDEKQANIMRLNWIVLREAPFDVSRHLYVGQCLPLGRPFCCGTY